MTVSHAESLKRSARRRSSRYRLSVALAIAATVLAPAVSPKAEKAANWIGTWTASPQPVWEGDFPLPTDLPFNLWNQTIRQVAGVSLGGKRVRVVLSNAYGARPLVVGAAHIALAGQGSEITVGSDRALTFGGKPTVTIPPGAPAVSDPVDLDVPALSNVAVSLFLPEPTPISTFHWEGVQKAYIGAGNLVGADKLQTNTTIKSRAFLSEILVDAPPEAGAVVALGDSITDGAVSTPDTNHRWPDFLARRLVKDNIAVLNAGISGGRVLKDRMGVSALARFDRDVLSQPRIKAVVVLMGINDIGWPGHVFDPREPSLAAEQLVAGYRQLIARARIRNLRIVGATLTPFEGALEGTPLVGYYSLDKEKVRQQVNAWIRTSGEFDAVIDFDAVMKDPEHPTRMLPAYDSGDHLHPGDAGYKAMADAIDLRLLFGKP